MLESVVRWVVWEAIRCLVWEAILYPIENLARHIANAFRKERA